jgi:tetrahydrodipicolinate N-succinyltransferase
MRPSEVSQSKRLRSKSHSKMRPSMPRLTHLFSNLKMMILKNQRKRRRPSLRMMMKKRRNQKRKRRRRF